MSKQHIESYFTIPHFITKTQTFKDLKPTSKYMYVILCQLENHFKKDFWHSLKDLSEATGFSKFAVQSARKELIEKGYLEILDHGNRKDACTYRLLTGR